MTRRIHTLLAACLLLSLAACASSRGVSFCQSYVQDGMPDIGIIANLYSQWDNDDDGYLSGMEWRTGVLRNRFEGWDGYYTAWDANVDGVLHFGEFKRSVDQAGLFDRWDGDGQLSLSECEAGNVFAPRGL